MRQEKEQGFARLCRSEGGGYKPAELTSSYLLHPCDASSAGAEALVPGRELLGTAAAAPCAGNPWARTN